MSQESNVLFRINNLYCSYHLDGSKCVLHIPQLEIPRAKLVFIVGPSGCGKSTLLELLGLMNFTISSGSVEFFVDQATSVQLEEIWLNENQLSSFRRKNFSFIFQNTNLMENLTVYDNVNAAQMIQGSAEYAKATQRTASTLAQVNLDSHEINATTFPNNISGGQRQRVSFARALATESQVMLCDEPTGNLDEVNAVDLIGVLKEQCEAGRSIIIVSHDIRLAINYADAIISLRKTTAGYGILEPTDIYMRHQWQSMSADEVRDFSSALLACTTEESIPNTPEVVLPMNANESFRNYSSLLRKKEAAVLSGKRKGKLILSTLIFFITLLALGFGNGSIEYLKKKASNPLVNYVSLEIDWGIDEEVSKMLKRINSRSTEKERFHINYLSGFYEQLLHPLTYSKNNMGTTSLVAECRTIGDVNDKLLEVLLDSANCVAGGQFNTQCNLDVVVTEKFLRRLGYSEFPATLVFSENSIRLNGESQKVYNLPIPIVAVVKEIPGKFDILMLESLYHFLMTALDLDLEKHQLSYIIRQEDVAQVESKVPGLLDSHKLDSNHVTMRFSSECDPSWMNGKIMTLEFDFPRNGDMQIVRELIMEELAPGKDINAVSEFENFADSSPHKSNEAKFSNGAIYFDDLDSVRAFQKFLYEESRKIGANQIADLDTQAVTEKENFNFMLNQVRIISWLVLFFGVISVTIFIYNLLKSHLEKVKMNIGTFKAFGLSDRDASGIYLRIIMKFIATSILIGFCLALVAGYCFACLLKQYLPSEEDMELFELFHSNTYIAIGIMLGISILVGILVVRKILYKTPGDLIYNR